MMFNIFIHNFTHADIISPMSPTSPNVKRTELLPHPVAAERTRKWHHTANICLQPMQYMLHNFSKGST